MADLITTLAVTAYIAADLWAARRLYGTWRARSIDKANWCSDPVERFNEVDRPFVMMAAFAGALAWPITLVCWGMYRWFDGTPVRSRRELAVEREAMARRIRELEAELGIKGAGR